MTPTSSHPQARQALRLPRDFALITVAIDAVMVLVNMTLQLWPDSPNAEQLRSVLHRAVEGMCETINVKVE